MKRYMIAGLAVDMDVSGQTEKRAAAYAAANEGPADITLDCDIRGVLALNPELKSFTSFPVFIPKQREIRICAGTPMAKIIQIFLPL